MGRPLLLQIAVSGALCLGCGSGPAWSTEGPIQAVYATYLGGNGMDQTREVIPYPDGSALVVGATHSTDLMTTEGAFQRSYAGDDPALGHPGIFGGDAYLARLAPDGRSIERATYFGGSKQERGAYGIELDGAGNVVIGGATRSEDLPTTPGAFQPKYGGGKADAFVAKLTADLDRLLWCTYVGGSGEDWPRGGIALDAEGNVFSVGRTDSTDLPAPGGVVARPGRSADDSDMMVFAVSGDGSRLVTAAAVGGSDWDGSIGLRIRPNGGLVLSGHTGSPDFPVRPDAPQTELGGEHDGFVAELSPDGTEVRRATYLGGRGDEYPEHRVWLAADGSTVASGFTGSPEYPWATRRVPEDSGDGDAFVARYSESGELVASVLLGGSGSEFLMMPVQDEAGNVYAVGYTTSEDFPVTPGALQPRYGGGNGDAVLVVLSPGLDEIRYATYLGGSGHDFARGLARTDDGHLYLVGVTESDDFPVTPGAVQPNRGQRSDGFVVKLRIREGHRFE